MRPSQQNMTLVIVCECAVLWAFQIIKRASSLQHRFRVSFDRTRRSSPCLMAQNHAPAALLRLSCTSQKGAYRVGGVRFKPCSPHINSIYGFWDVSQVCQICQIKVFLPGAFLDPQVLSDAESFALCLIFFPLWFHYKQPHFQNGDCSISVFQCFLQGHAHHLLAPCDTEKM